MNNINVCINDENCKYSGADYSIAISWKWIITNVDNLIVLHDSLLPKYRGFAPLVSQLIEGEKDLGVSAIFANEFYDQGDIIIQKSVCISYPIKISKAIEVVSQCYLECIKYILNLIINDKAINSRPQEDFKATYSLWRDDHDYFINWMDTSHNIKRFIDAVGKPYQGAISYLNSREIIIEEADIFQDVSIHNRDVGKVIFIIDSKPIVVCKEGLLIIEKAFYKDNKNSIIPFKNIRSRFNN